MGDAVHTHVTPDSVPLLSHGWACGEMGSALDSASDPTSILSLQGTVLEGFEKLKKKKKPQISLLRGFGIHYTIITLSILLQECLLFFLLDPK